MPEFRRGCETAECPVELLTHRITVDDPLGHLDHICIRIRLRQDPIIAFVQVTADVSCEAAAERGDLRPRRDERLWWQPAFEDEVLDRARQAHVRDTRAV